MKRSTRVETQEYSFWQLVTINGMSQEMLETFNFIICDAVNWSLAWSF